MPHMRIDNIALFILRRDTVLKESLKSPYVTCIAAASLLHLSTVAKCFHIVVKLMLS